MKLSEPYEGRSKKKNLPPYSHAWMNCNWLLKRVTQLKNGKHIKIIDEIEAFQKMKRLRPSRANFVDAFRCNDVLKRRIKKWGGKFIITMTM